MGYQLVLSCEMPYMVDHYFVNNISQWKLLQWYIIFKLDPARKNVNVNGAVFDVTISHNVKNCHIIYGYQVIVELIIA